MSGKSARSRSKWVLLCALCILSVFLTGILIAAMPGVQKTAANQSASPSVSATASSKTQIASKIGMKAVWITTAYHIDFPSKTGLSAAVQKAEIDKMLDQIRGWGMNTVFVQVRSNADALYSSALFPWSEVLTGTQGKNPGYDPLQYFVAAAHKRGLSIQAWVNPYRIQSVYDLSELAAASPAVKHKDWTVKTSENSLYFNPGLPEVRDLIEKGVLEIVKKYQVDGVVFDDYFYPAQDFNDGAAYKKYGGGKSLDDWRRSNVDTLIRELHEKIGQTRKGVVFGISPFAVWANASSNKAGSDTAASVQSYYTQYADTRMWVKNHLIDYICPQIYWSIGFEKAAYNKVMDWWAQTVQGTGVKLYVAHTVSKVGTDESGWKEPNQIIKQLEYSQKYGDYGGSSFYNYSKLVKNALGVTDTLKAYLSKH